jgi:predicted ArsR family transcriptional regulator
LNRDNFCRTLIRELAGTLQDVVGVQEASGFVSVVGQNIGREIEEEYKSALGRTRLTAEEVTGVLVDLKRRIEGDFYVIEQTHERIVLGNRACPFGEKVLNQPSMCMMTSNVFGVIAADNLGYARVELKETIAGGDRRCIVIVHLAPGQEGAAPAGREYFGPTSHDDG